MAPIFLPCRRFNRSAILTVWKVDTRPESVGAVCSAIAWALGLGTAVERLHTIATTALLELGLGCCGIVAVAGGQVHRMDAWFR
jgi:hypothetical protein